MAFRDGSDGSGTAAKVLSAPSVPDSGEGSSGAKKGSQSAGHCVNRGMAATSAWVPQPIPMSPAHFAGKRTLPNACKCKRPSL